MSAPCASECDFNSLFVARVTRAMLFITTLSSIFIFILIGVFCFSQNRGACGCLWRYRRSPYSFSTIMCVCATSSSCLLYYGVWCVRNFVALLRDIMYYCFCSSSFHHQQHPKHYQLVLSGRGGGVTFLLFSSLIILRRCWVWVLASFLFHFYRYYCSLPFFFSFWFIGSSRFGRVSAVYGGLFVSFGVDLFLLTLITVCVCVCVCTCYVCMYECVCLCIYVCIYVTYESLCVCRLMSMCVLQVCVYICMYVCLYLIYRCRS